MILIKPALLKAISPALPVAFTSASPVVFVSVEAFAVMLSPVSDKAAPEFSVALVKSKAAPAVSVKA